MFLVKCVINNYTTFSVLNALVYLALINIVWVQSQFVNVGFKDVMLFVKPVKDLNAFPLIEDTKE
jgi:hypothetical protein